MPISPSKRGMRRAVTRAQGRNNPNLRQEIRDQIASAECARRNFSLQLQGLRYTTASKATLRERIRSCENTISHLRGKLADLH